MLHTLLSSSFGILGFLLQRASLSARGGNFRPEKVLCSLFSLEHFFPAEMVNCHEEEEEEEEDGSSFGRVLVRTGSYLALWFGCVLSLSPTPPPPPSEGVRGQRMEVEEEARVVPAAAAALFVASSSSLCLAERRERRRTMGLE